MNRYVTSLFIVSILFLILGFISGKITDGSFSYISLTGSLYAILQILVVVVIIMLGIAITLPAIIIDLLLLIFTSMHFPLVNAIWNVIWDNTTMGWFWTTTTGSSLFFSSLILAIVSFLALRRKSRR